jgi:hypothetical protein
MAIVDDFKSIKARCQEMSKHPVVKLVGKVSCKMCCDIGWINVENGGFVCTGCGNPNKYPKPV